MTITKEEYDRVIIGLRQQLELHVRNQRELGAKIDALNEFVNELETRLGKEKALLSKFVVTCKRCGGCVTRRDNNWVHIEADGGYIYKHHKITFE